MNKRQLTKWRSNYVIWENPCTGQGLYLQVHFDEKDYVKRLGARWNPDPSGKGGHWWMPAKYLQTDCPIPCEIMGDGWSGTVEDYLNNHKMIFGQYGKQNADLCDEAVQEHNAETFQLESTDPTNGVQDVYWYEVLGICAFRKSNPRHNQFDWYSAEDGRKAWDMQVAAGYYRTVLEETS
jgi:hypothetical protein